MKPAWWVSGGAGEGGDALDGGVEVFCGAGGHQLEDFEDQAKVGITRDPDFLRVGDLADFTG